MIRAPGRTLAAAALAALFLAGPGAARAPASRGPLVLRVAPDGAAARDRLPDLPSALDRVAALRRAGETGAIVIQLEAGTHRLAQPARIGPEHAGPGDAPLTLRGTPDGAARLVGSVPLRPVPVPPRLRARIPEAARAGVRAYRLPDTLAREPAFRAPRRLADKAPLVTEIFDRRGALRPAQWPNTGYAAAAPAGAMSFTLRDGPPRPALPEPEMWAEGYWKWDWLNETLPLAGTGPREGTYKLAEATFDGIGDKARIRLVHLLSQLDEPGEWWRDRAAGILLAWPNPDAPDLEAGLAETLIVAEDARHLRIEHLRLERARGDLVVARGGADVVIDRSELAWAAGRAALFEDVAGGGIAGSSIHDIGAAAVRLASGDRAALLPGGLSLRDTRLTRFARLTRTQSAAVDLDGVGAQVTGNFIADAIGYAVHIRGNDHLFGRNEVARLIDGLSDSGAIYAGRDWTVRGNTVSENYVHDIRTAPGFEVKGVYLDDMAGGLSLRDNLFVNVQQPVFIGGGSDNDISGNLFVASSPAVTLDSRGQTWMADQVLDPGSEIRLHYAAVPVASRRWRERFPRLAGLLSDEPKVARDNRIVDNVYVNSKPLLTVQEGDPRRQTILLNTEITQPDFQPDGALAALTRLLAERKMKPRMNLEAMRRDGLPESPFSGLRR